MGFYRKRRNILRWRKTIEEADEAVERFRDRHEDMAETYLSSVRMKSYPTRSEARDADIGDDNGNIIW